jgi:hypothetical protein
MSGVTPRRSRVHVRARFEQSARGLRAVEASREQQRRLALLVPQLGAHPREDEELDADRLAVLRAVEEHVFPVRVAA